MSKLNFEVVSVVNRYLDEQTQEHLEAIARSHSELKEWVEITGCVIQNRSLYFEMQSLLERAVQLGRESILIERGELSEFSIEPENE